MTNEIESAAEEFYSQFVWDSNAPQEAIHWQRKCDVKSFTAGAAWRDKHPSREMVEKIRSLSIEPKNSGYCRTIDEIMAELGKEK